MTALWREDDLQGRRGNMVTKDSSRPACAPHPPPAKRAATGGHHLSGPISGPTPAASAAELGERQIATPMSVSRIHSFSGRATRNPRVVVMRARQSKWPRELRVSPDATAR